MTLKLFVNGLIANKSLKLTHKLMKG